MQSPINLYAPFQQRVDDALNNKHQKTALNRMAGNMSGARVRAMGEVDGETLRSQVRQMKEYVVRHLPELLVEFENQVTANGGQVHWARDAAEATAIVRQLARNHDVATVVKSKSMVTEEIHLNSELEGIGVRTVETDLGEYIIQLVNEPPSHIVAPVIHKRLEDIAEIFQQKLDMPPTLDPEAMCTAARTRLRQDFFSADMGISGCNFGVVETGHVCIVTNEGNGRMVSSMPRVYVAIMGIEKLVPTIEDAFLQYQALCRSAAGQRVSVYLSMTGGPRKPGDADGPAEFHVILLDNGRSDMLAGGYGEALMCIRCGACLNICPVYREVGGHAYGSTYSGPIGAVISPLLHAPITDPQKLPQASSLCGACRDACPVKIDLPGLLLDLRAEYVELGNAPRFEEMAIRGFVRAMRSRRTYELAGQMARLATGALAGLSGGNIKFAPPPLNGWTQSRDLPPFAPKSFRQFWAERSKWRKSIHGDAAPTVSPYAERAKRTTDDNA